MKGRLLWGCIHPRRKLVFLMSSFTPRGRPADSGVQIWRRRCTTAQTQNAHSAPSLALLLLIPLLLSPTPSFAPRPGSSCLHSCSNPPLQSSHSYFPTHSFAPQFCFVFFPPTGRWHHPRPSIKFPFGTACTDSPLSAQRCQPVSMAS